MRSLNVRHPAMRCVAEALLDLFPSGADISEIGTDNKPCLFVSWRTSGMASHPGNIAWGVHYRFEAEALSLFNVVSDLAQKRFCEQVRDVSRHLKFDYADPDAVSLLIVDVSTGMVRQSMAVAG
jgi:hypothetical protein